jgi:hypothetical protein
MRSIVTVWIALLSIAGNSLLACEIEQARNFEVGISKGIEGKCSNNGEEITCTLDANEPSWTCKGPGGRFDHLGEDLTQTLIAQACECSSHLRQ